LDHHSAPLPECLGEQLVHGLWKSTPGIASTRAKRTVKFPDGIVVPALGQGSAQLAQGRRSETVEEEALVSEIAYF